MGILTDIFVASRDDALGYEEELIEGDVHACARFELVQLKRINFLDFSNLWAILRDEKLDVKRHMLPDIAHSESGETATFEFPADFVERVVRLPDDAIGRTAAAWAQTAEFRGAMSGEALDAVIKEFRRLAQSAQATGKSLFVWNSI